MFFQAIQMSKINRIADSSPGRTTHLCTLGLPASYKCPQMGKTYGYRLTGDSRSIRQFWPVVFLKKNGRVDDGCVKLTWQCLLKISDTLGNDFGMLYNQLKCTPECNLHTQQRVWWKVRKSPTLENWRAEFGHATVQVFKATVKGTPSKSALVRRQIPYNTKQICSQGSEVLEPIAIAGQVSINYTNLQKASRHTPCPISIVSPFNFDTLWPLWTTSASLVIERIYTNTRLILAAVLA